MPSAGLNQKAFALGILALSLVWTAFQAWYLAKVIPFGGFPDEPAHWTLITHWRAGETAALDAIGPLEKIQPLYYWLASGIVDFLSFLDEISVLRTLSFLFGCLFLIISFYYTFAISGSWLSGAGSAVVLSNTLSFVYMSTAISWDMIANAMIIASIFLFALRFQGSGILMYWSCIGLSLSTLALAALVKWSSLALVPVTISLLLVDAIWFARNRQAIGLKELMGFDFHSPQQRTIVILVSVLLAILLALNVQIHGSNLFIYHSFNPTCDSIWDHQKCMEVVEEYRVHYNIHAAHIDEQRYDFITFLPFYLDTLFIRLLSFFSHKSYFYSSSFMLLPHAYVIVGGIAVTYGYYRKKGFSWSGRSGRLVEAAVIFLVFLAILVLQNYQYYLWIGNPDAAAGIQGRYLLPVWPCLVALACASLAPIERKFPPSVTYGVFIPTLQVLLMTPSFLYFVDRVLGDPGRMETARQLCSSVDLEIQRSAEGLSNLARKGHIDAVQLEDSGSTLIVSGWIAPPTGRDKIDTITVGLNIPVDGGELVREVRPDVVRAKSADTLCTGFTISLRLTSPLETLPTNTTLCVAASSKGKALARTHDRGGLQCR